MTSPNAPYDTQALLQGLGRDTIVTARASFDGLIHFATISRVQEEATQPMWMLSKPKDVQQDDLWSQLYTAFKAGADFGLTSSSRAGEAPLPGSKCTFMSPSSVKADSRDLLTGSGVSQETQVDESAWQETFRGDAADVFLDTLYRLAEQPIRRSQCSPGKPEQQIVYARYLPIVQSSGTGKSRMLDHVAQSNYVVPINIRVAAGGFPPADKSVVKYFDRRLPDEPRARLGCAMTVLNAFWIGLLEQLLDRLVRPGHTTPSQWRTFFTEGMTATEHNLNRRRFFEAVCERANELVDTMSLEEFTNTPDPDGPSNSDRPRLFRSKDNPGVSFSATLAAKHLYEALGQKPPKCPLIVSFDECHTIFHRRLVSDKESASNGSQAPETVLSAFRLSLRAFPVTPVVGVVLSTALSAEQYLPPTSADPSARLGGSTDASRREPSEPFCLLGWDQLVSGRTLQDSVDDFGSIVHFGRPLFGATYNHLQPSARDVDTLAFAVRKLLLAGDISSDSIHIDLRSSRFNFQQALAVVGALIPLDLSLASRPPQILFHEQPEQVRGFMAVLKAYHLSLGICKVDRPSEPVLAVAAVHALWIFAKPLPLDVALETLKELALPPGERGELLTMLLFVMAQHRVSLLGSEIDSHNNPSTYVKPVTLTSFLEAFVPRQQLSDLPTGGRVRVLQFIKLTESNYIPGHKDLAQAFRRGVAYACAPLQSDIDIIVPICYGDGVSEKNMGYGLVQVKNEAAGANLAKAMTGVSNINKTKDFQSNGQPLLQMVISLRGKSVAKGKRVDRKTAQGTQRADLRSNATATHAASSATPSPPAVFQITVQDVTCMSILESQETSSQKLHPRIGSSKSATEFLVSGGACGKAMGSNNLFQRMAPLAGSALVHHSYDPGYEGAHAALADPEASNPLSDDEGSDRVREGRDPGGSDVNMTEM